MLKVSCFIFCNMLRGTFKKARKIFRQVIGQYDGALTIGYNDDDLKTDVFVAFCCITFPNVVHGILSF